MKTVAFRAFVLALSFWVSKGYSETALKKTFDLEQPNAKDSTFQIPETLEGADSLGVQSELLDTLDSFTIDPDSIIPSEVEKLRPFAVFMGLGIQFNSLNLIDAFSEAGDSLRNRKDAINPATREYRRTPFDQVLLSSPLNVSIVIRDSVWGAELGVYYEYGRNSSTITSLINPESEVLTIHSHHYSLLPSIRFYIPPAVFSVTGYTSVYISWGPMIALRRSKLSWHYGEIVADKALYFSGTQLKIGGRFLERKAFFIDGEFYYTTHRVDAKNLEQSLFTQNLSSTPLNTWAQNGIGLRLLMGYAWH